MKKNAEKAAVDYTAHMNLTRFDEKIAAELPALPEWASPR